MEGYFDFENFQPESFFFNFHQRSFFNFQSDSFLLKISTHTVFVAKTFLRASFEKWPWLFCVSEIYVKVEMSPLITKLHPAMRPITLSHTIRKGLCAVPTPYSQTQASLAPTTGEKVGWSVTNTFRITLCRPQAVVNFLKVVTSSFQTLIYKLYFCKVYLAYASSKLCS